MHTKIVYFMLEYDTKSVSYSTPFKRHIKINIFIIYNIYCSSNFVTNNKYIK